MTIRAHFDGKVIVPDEPLDLPVGQELEVELRRMPLAEEPPLDKQALIADRLRRLNEASGRIAGPVIPDEALRRENLYEGRL